jgi:hypothetical protein
MLDSKVAEELSLDSIFYSFPNSHDLLKAKRSFIFIPVVWRTVILIFDW